MLGRLGGVFHGTVMEYLPGRELFIADAWWLPPDDEPIGPMALEVSCMLEGASCRLRVRQSGFEDSPRWRRYYAVIARGLAVVSGVAQGRTWSADPADVQEVGVAAVLLGTHVDEHDDRARGEQAAVDELRVSDGRCCARP